MKKNYVFVLLLILFSVIAANYFIKNKPTKKDTQQNVASNTASSPISQNDNDDLDIPGAVTVNAPILQSETGNRHLYAKAHTSHRHKANGNGGGIQNAGYMQDQDMTHEVSNTYFGNRQKPDDKRYIVYSAIVTSEGDGDMRHSRIHFGPEIGVNQNGLSHNNTPNIGTVGFHAGVVMDLELGSNFSLQPELMYIRKGNKLQNTMDVNTKERLLLHYVELPVNIVYKIGDINNNRFMIGAGPYFSYLVNARDQFQTTTGEDIIGFIPATASYQPANMRSFDWGLGAFIGCETPDGLYAKAGAETGMTNIQRNMDGSYSNRNYDILISVGYLLGN